MLPVHQERRTRQDHESTRSSPSITFKGQPQLGPQRNPTQLDGIQAALDDQFPRVDAAGSDFYPIASDTYFENSLNYCNEVSPMSTGEKRGCRVGLLVGDSFLLSALPSLKKHVDTVVVADYNPRMLDMIRFKLETLREAPTRQDFLNRLLSVENPHLGLLPKPYRGDLNDADYRAARGRAFQACLTKKLPSMSFLMSDTHYDRAQQAARETVVCFACVNLFDTEQSGRSGALLRTSLVRLLC